MAIVLQGCTAQWGGVTISEVRQVEMDLQRGLPLGRQVIWTLDLGQVRVTTFGVGTLSDAEYGKRKVLRIVLPSTINPGASLVTLVNQDAIYQDVVVTAEANDVLRFAHVFRLMDTFGAPSTP